MAASRAARKDFARHTLGLPNAASISRLTFTAISFGS
jgi:hypothetical protein